MIKKERMCVNMYGEKRTEEEKMLDTEINSGLRQMKFDEDDYGTVGSFSERDFGICFDCRCLYAFKTEYGTVWGKCYEFEVTMNGINKIKHCTRYNKKGQMSLDDMKDCAILIDVEKKTVGFV
jgi:hypothetical protein